MDRLRKKLHTVFKLSGFLVRSEFCSLILEKFEEEDIDLYNNEKFDSYVKRLCDILENQSLPNKSIEKNDIEEALKVCLHSGRDKNKNIFNVINAFDIPKLHYNSDRKLYAVSKNKTSLLPEANSKTQLFCDRYTTIFQRTLRNFKNMDVGNENERPSLQSVSYLLTSDRLKLYTTLVLGSLLQVTDGKYFLEDPTGMVELDLTHAKYRGRFFLENTFVLVNGYYEDKILHVSTIALPPGERYADSRNVFNNINYFGGPSLTSLRESKALNEIYQNSASSILFFSDVWLDHPMVFEKLELLFNGLHDFPPIAFVFMGNFMEELNALEKMNDLKKLFKQFGELLVQFPNLVQNSHFVFVPGMVDPSMLHIVPRFSLPNFITEDFRKHIPNAIFTTNPCHIQYCDKEIVVFRADLLAKLTQGTICRPNKEDEEEEDSVGSLVKIVIGQGHLCPVPLNALTVHWEYDYTLRLYPLPDLIVLGDKCEPYHRTYKECKVVNPGSFCDTGFLFTSYVPSKNLLSDCSL